MPERNQTLRRACLTLNNYTEEEYNGVITRIRELARYAVVGRERGTVEGTDHLQMYIAFKKPIKFNSIRLAFPRSHIECAKGSEQQNFEYCTKEDQDAFIHGSIGGQGYRSDLASAAKTLIESNGDEAKVAEDHPEAFIKYYRGLREYRKILLPIARRSHKTKLYVFWGEPGSGKSYSANILGGASVYYKSRGDWWDGYKQQETVIIDDFYGWLKYDELLRISDRYPHVVPIKGSFEEFTSSLIIITSNAKIEDWYKFDHYDPTPLYRRCTKYIHCKQQVWTPMDVIINF